MLYTVFTASPDFDIHLAVAWCKRVLDQHCVFADGTANFNWTVRTVRVVPYRHVQGLHYCWQFTFAESQHKFLFDLAWSHLGIYDSVQLCQAATGY